MLKITFIFFVRNCTWIQLVAVHELVDTLYGYASLKRKLTFKTTVIKKKYQKLFENKHNNKIIYIFRFKEMLRNIIDILIRNRWR